MIKLKKLVKEIGEGTSQPFEYTVIEKYPRNEGITYEIKITDDIIIEFEIGRYKLYSDDDMYTTLLKQYDIIDTKPLMFEYVISFDITTSTAEYLQHSNYKYAQNFLNTEQLLRLMATIVELIKKHNTKISNDEYYTYEFEPIKNVDSRGEFIAGDNKRLNLYMVYLKKHLPSNFEIHKENNPFSTRDTKIYFYPKHISP